MAAAIRSSANYDENFQSTIMKQIVDKMNSLGMFHPGYVSGRSYATFPNVSSTAAAVPAIDTIYFYPFVLPRRVLINALTARTTTSGAGSSGKLAIYASSLTTMNPVGAPVAKDETGFTTQSSSQDRSAALSPSVQLEDGLLYWGASKFTGTLPTMVNVAAGNLQTSFMRGSTGSGFTLNSLSMADTYASAWPTIAAAQAFTELASSGVPQLGFTVA